MECSDDYGCLEAVLLNSGVRFYCVSLRMMSERGKA